MNTQKCNSTSHMGYVHVPGTPEDIGMLITGSLQDMDSGPGCNSSDGHGFMGRKASQSRRISQAKAQKQELVVCRDWQAEWLGRGKGKRKLKTDTGYKRESEWRL